MKKILGIIFTLSLLPYANAEVPTKFPVMGKIKASQFDTSQLENEKEKKRRASAKSIPISQAKRCIAFTYGANTLGYNERNAWGEHLKYYHDISDYDVLKITSEAEREMKSLLAKTDVTWKQVHRTYFRECSGYWKITS